MASWPGRNRNTRAGRRNKKPASCSRWPGEYGKWAMRAVGLLSRRLKVLGPFLFAILIALVPMVAGAQDPRSLPTHPRRRCGTQPVPPWCGRTPRLTGVVEVSRTILLLALITVVVLSANGVAMAYGGGDPKTIECEGGECRGTPNSETMRGTHGRDIMYGRAGWDDIYGLGGKDRLYGDASEDDLYGNAGDDKLSGGAQQDSLYGGDGSDSLNGGKSGDYELNGAAGDDRLFGGPGKYSDVLVGGGENDELYGQEGDDLLYGQEGDDLLNGGKGIDEFYAFGPTAGWGNDTISDPDAYPDRLVQTTISFLDWPPREREPARDTIINLVPRPGHEVTDGTNTVDWSEPGFVYAVYAGSADDTITGDEWKNVLVGYRGADTIRGGGGDDGLIGGLGAGSDSVDGGDTLYGEEGDDTVLGIQGNDTLGGGLGEDTLRGGEDNDLIRANTPSEEPGVSEKVFGDAGDDTIEAQDGSPDAIDCGEGNDTVTFDADLDTVTNCENAVGDE
jgi:Ca2+-binding RTX toxin-like protein